MSPEQEALPLQPAACAGAQRRSLPPQAAIILQTVLARAVLQAELWASHPEPDISSGLTSPTLPVPPMVD